MDSISSTHRPLTATVNPDSLRADRGSLFGLADNDTRRSASRQANVLSGNEGNGTLSGGRQDDVINGGAGSDQLCGNKGNDFLNGGAGFDTLKGGKGNDTLVDYYGGDSLTGGKGKDIFGVGGTLSKVASMITDFKIGEDQLKVLRLGSTFENLTFKDNNCGTIVFDAGQAIAELQGVKASGLKADSFIFSPAKPVNTQFDAQYNQLSALLGAYSDPDTRQLAEQVADQVGYVVDRVFEDPANDFTAVGFRAKDGSKPPVLVLPGGNPGDPTSVGNPEFTANGKALRNWLVAIAGDSQKNPQGFKPDVTGASRGGAITQLVASAFPTLIGSGVSFKSPGVNAGAADDFLSNGGDPSQIRHYITSGDSVSLSGEAFIPGTVTLATYKTPGFLDPSLSAEQKLQQLGEDFTRKHQSGILADFSSLLPDTSNPIIAAARALTDKPAGLTLSPISVDDFNRPDFTYQDEDWLLSQKQVQTQTNNPNLRFFQTRAGTEELRKNYGAGDVPSSVELQKRQLGGPGNVLNLIYPTIAGLKPISIEQINQPTAGNDVIFGTTRDDQISGLAGDDYMRGGDGNDTLFGNAGDDVLIGNSGNDILSGGAGFNILTGGEGRDRFVFDTVFVSATKVGDRVSRINDFTPGEDKIGLSKTIFTGLPHNLASVFGTVTNEAEAAVSQALLVYNKSNGSLTYNANGATAGFGDTGGQIAFVFGQPTLTDRDFKLV
ncbi:M10 family metallopeptidase C-terminal domain-containing protein [Phormidesmis sp. 146-20]